MTSNNLNGHNDLTRPEPSLVDHNYVMLTITRFQIKFIPEQARLEPVEPYDIDYVSFFESNWPLVTSSLIWPCQACKIFMVSPCKPSRKDVSLELLLNARVHQPYHASGWQRITTKSVFLLPSCWLRDMVDIMEEKIVQQIVMVPRRHKLEKSWLVQELFWFLIS